jgi:hypothetical protein
MGNANDTVFQYNLSVAYDISTASYSNISFSVASQEDNPNAVCFKPDGTKMYVVGYTNDTIYQYTTGSTLTTNTLDLSTGSAFQITPTSDIQVGLSNPAASGTVSQATLLLGAEDPTGVSSTFSTTLYAGTSPSAQTITNGIDLAGDGGLVWLKSRTEAQGHSLFDTERGANELLISDLSTGSQTVSNRGVTSFNSDGFDLGGGTGGNRVSNDYVSWSFKKQDSFFDIVTYSGTGNAGLTINHNLGSIPGCIIIKSIDDSRDWAVYHRGVDATNPEDYALVLQKTVAREDNVAWFNDTAPTATQFTVGNKLDINRSGYNYIAYLFAHDTPATSAIKCGSYTGTGNGVTMSVDLGWPPQWIMIKRTDGATDWRIIDNVRGIPDSGNAPSMRANTTGDEQSSFEMNVTDTGFSTSDGSDQVNISGGNYVYIAIRNPSASTVTYDSSIQFSGGTAPDSPAIGETDVLTFSTRDGGTTYQAAQAIDGAV